MATGSPTPGTLRYVTYGAHFENGAAVTCALGTVAGVMLADQKTTGAMTAGRVLVIGDPTVVVGREGCTRFCATKAGFCGDVNTGTEGCGVACPCRVNCLDGEIRRLLGEISRLVYIFGDNPCWSGTESTMRELANRLLNDTALRFDTALWYSAPGWGSPRYACEYSS